MIARRRPGPPRPKAYTKRSDPFFFLKIRAHSLNSRICGAWWHVAPPMHASSRTPLLLPLLLSHNLPTPPCSLVRDGQTHPHRPRLVVSHSTCPPLSSSPPANSFVIGPAVIKHTHMVWGLGLGLDSLSHFSSHALPFFSPPSFHTLCPAQMELDFMVTLYPPAPTRTALY